MEKKIYEEPKIKVLTINNEDLLAALSGGDKHDEFPDEGEGQFSKGNNTWAKTPNAWTTDED